MASTLTNILIHVVFSTKDRKPVISDKYRGRLYAYIGGVVKKEGAELLAIGGTADHIHLAMKIRSSHVFSDIMRKIKANSSKWINDNRFVSERFAWQSGYGGFSVSASQIEKVRHYIDNQAEHHKSRPFKEELLEMLTKHGVDFDPEYLWN